MEEFEKELGELGELDELEKEFGELEELGGDSTDPIDMNELGELEEIQPAAPAEEKPQVIQDALGGISTFVDIVFCIDITGSMGPIINTVKELTLGFYDELIDTMREKNSRIVEQLRVKVIGFRDFYCDGSYALEESDFFLLPQQKEAFHSFVSSLEAKGGGDEPENSLEALALAMKTDWVKVENPNTQRARNVIVMFTDTSAHPLEKAAGGVSNPLYPSDMAKSYLNLYEAWNGQAGCESGADQYNMDQRARRLVVFAPEDAYPWSEMAEEFDNAAVVPISAAQGGAELGRDTIIATISGSIQ